MPRRDPNWLTRDGVEAIQAIQLEQHGGLYGVRDVGELEATLRRPQHKWYDKSIDDVPACAAAYGFGIAKNRAFSDGNKRTAFVAMVVFLERNGFAFSAPEPDAVTTMIGVASGTIKEKALAGWLRANVKKRRR